MAAFGAGSLAGGLAALGRRPRRPLLVVVIASFGYPIPILLRALHAPALPVAAAGPVAAVVGASSVLGFGAAVAALASLTVVALPAVRAVRWHDTPD
ncbi:MAG: hypothetical protein ACYDH5_15455 [Acidimicrobiales bacterium]